MLDVIFTYCGGGWTNDLYCQCYSQFFVNCQVIRCYLKNNMVL